jgi:predicted phage tail protein
MVVIHLYGVLEETAQRVVRLQTSSFTESMRGLVANFPKLASVLRNMRVSVLVNGEMMQFEDCLRPMEAERIDIMPIVGGAGPAIFIVVGAAITAGAATIAGLFAGTMLASVITTAAVAQFGLAMIIGGITQLLFKPPKPNIGSRAEDTASYNFNGAVNVSQQGNIVPVGYGRLKVGSMVIAANIQTWDIPIEPPAVPAELPEVPPENPEGPFLTEPEGGSGGGGM